MITWFQFITFVFHCHFVHWFLSCMQCLLSSLCFVPEECLNSVNVMSFSIFPAQCQEMYVTFCVFHLLFKVHILCSSVFIFFFVINKNDLNHFYLYFLYYLKILFSLNYLSFNWRDFFVLCQYLHFHSKPQCFI